VGAMDPEQPLPPDRLNDDNRRPACPQAAIKCEKLDEEMAQEGQDVSAELSWPQAVDSATVSMEGADGGTRPLHSPMRQVVIKCEKLEEKMIEKADEVSPERGRHQVVDCANVNMDMDVKPDTGKLALFVSFTFVHLVLWGM